MHHLFGLGLWAGRPFFLTLSIYIYIYIYIYIWRPRNEVIFNNKEIVPDSKLFIIQQYTQEVNSFDLSVFILFVF